MHQLVLAQAKHELRTAEYYYVRHAYVAESYEALEMHDLANDARRVYELNKGKDVKVRRELHR